MRLGVMAFTGVEAVPVGTLAAAAEARGIDTFYVPEHTHIPISRRSPFPAGGDLPDFYYGLLDPFVALSVAAASTSEIRLGTAITLVAQHDPITLAKSVASLDVVSAGRVVLGCGFGWNVEEFENHGRGQGRDRWAIGREVILAMEALWDDDVASFTGDFVSFETSDQRPKPVQRPRPPILLGGAGSDANFGRIAEFGDGWFPLVAGRSLPADIERLRGTVADAGRDPASVDVVCGLPVLDAKYVDRYREFGADEVVLALPVSTESEVMGLLDAFAAFAD